MNLKRRNSLPFTAIVGQEKLKKALILNAINPDINGVLIKGERGTAKSTAVRAIAELLPEIEVVRDCSFNCNPNLPSLQCDVCRQRLQNGDNLPVLKRKMRVCDLPLSATEDRVIGTLDIEKALDEGIKALQPGILAEVNQGILYIDEVNLLDDHLVDTLLDAAAMGVNIIERENLSISHPSRFILVGTMNPEEGELRPQLLDRFGLQVDVIGESATGKTTLAKSIMRLFLDEDVHVDGKVALNGENLLELDTSELRKVRWNRVAMVFQNVESALNPAYSILNQIVEPMIETGVDKKKAKKRAYDLLQKMGISNLAQSYPHQLSNGEVQRVAIARALILEPKLIIADEPTSSLDASVQAKILKLLNHIQEERGLGILFISHDIALARKISDRIAVMHSGKIVEEGITDQVIYSPVHPYTRKLLKAAPSLLNAVSKSKRSF